MGLFEDKPAMLLVTDSEKVDFDSQFLFPTPPTSDLVSANHDTIIHGVILACVAPYGYHGDWWTATGRKISSPYYDGVWPVTIEVAVQRQLTFLLSVGGTLCFVRVAGDHIPKKSCGVLTPHARKAPGFNKRETSPHTLLEIIGRECLVQASQEMHVGTLENMVVCGVDYRALLKWGCGRYLSDLYPHTSPCVTQLATIGDPTVLFTAVGLAGIAVL